MCAKEASRIMEISKISGPPLDETGMGANKEQSGAPNSFGPEVYTIYSQVPFAPFGKSHIYQASLPS